MPFNYQMWLSCSGFSESWASETARWVKALPSKLYDLSWIPGTHMLGGGNKLPEVL